MIFDFGPFAEFLEITTQYSNAVLVAVLPYVSDFSQKLNLRPAVEFTTNAVSRMVINPKSRDVSGSILFTNGYAFNYGRGHITSFFGPGAYSKVRDYQKVPNYFSPSVKMSRTEAVDLARTSIKKLGYQMEQVFADFEPDVTLPEKIDKNVIPFYMVKWADPRGGHAASVEINGNRQSVEGLNFSCNNLDLAPFQVDVVAPKKSVHPLYGKFTGINPEYGYRLLPIVLREITNYTAKLGIDVPRPLTTNYIKRFWVEDNGGWPHSELELTNGARFLYRNTNVTGYFAPDEFWNSEKRKILISDFKGSWRMSDKQMVELARQTLAKLGYANEFIHIGDQPELLKPKGRFERVIPRCKVEWMYPNGANMTQWSYVEIDADTRQVKAVYFDDESFRKAKPAIDVPISLEP